MNKKINKIEQANDKIVENNIMWALNVCLELASSSEKQIKNVLALIQ
jgi:hypothetical protein